tara:strand:+ start:340 stop:1695 length:1356 start_codon:yes stop_codon:yes gene_type:complete
MHKTKLAASVAIVSLFFGNFALAAESNKDIDTLRAEIQNMKQVYEKRIANMEAQLGRVEKKRNQSPVSSGKKAPTTSSRRILSNSFNPSVGLVLNGTYSNFSSGTSEIPGFGMGEEGERGKEGPAIGESEMNFSASVDDKFYGSLTSAIVNEDGADKIELEEAYLQSLPGLGLPTGLDIKAGRALWKLGYLNEHHAHTDDFADRPLPYRAYLNKAYNDDGLATSYVLPTNFYSEIGGGMYRADDFPFGTADGENTSWSAFARVGSDIGNNQSWRLGGYLLSGDSKTTGRKSNEDAVIFKGESDLYVTDLRYVWAPTGNARNKEVIFQMEYFKRSEDGTYDDTENSTGEVAFDDTSSGLYLQGVYKFTPRWRVGARYSKLFSPDVPTGLVDSNLDSKNFDPRAYAGMIDWTNSEFSRVRLQYNHEKLKDGQTDKQFMMQYVISIGAHGAHAY